MKKIIKIQDDIRDTYFDNTIIVRGIIPLNFNINIYNFIVVAMQQEIYKERKKK